MLTRLVQTQPSPVPVTLKDPPTILIVDDNVELLEELQEILSNHGYDVHTVSDSSKVLAMVHELRPDLMVVDLKMSPKTGFQVADEIRRSGLGPDELPIIAMTGYFTEEEHVLMMKLCGIQLYILKPFSPSSLIAKFEVVLGLRDGQAGEQEAI